MIAYVIIKGDRERVVMQEGVPTTGKPGIFVHGIRVRTPCDKYGEDVTGFITPFWLDIFLFYPEYVDALLSEGKRPYKLQPYMLTVAKELVRNNARKEYDTDEKWLKRLIEHHSMHWLETWVERYKELHKAIDDAFNSHALGNVKCVKCETRDFHKPGDLFACNHCGSQETPVNL